MSHREPPKLVVENISKDTLHSEGIKIEKGANPQDSSLGLARQTMMSFCQKGTTQVEASSSTTEL